MHFRCMNCGNRLKRIQANIYTCCHKYYVICGMLSTAICLGDIHSQNTAVARALVFLEKQHWCMQYDEKMRSPKLINRVKRKS